jgi:hypothetical protein
MTPWNRDTVEFIGKVRLLKDRGHSSRQIAENENCDNDTFSPLFAY